jgi:PAS domain S-box-containing protein
MTMKNLVGILKQYNFLKNKLLRNIFLVSVFLAVALPFSYLLLIHPSFQKLLTDDKKDDSISIARHLSSFIPLQGNELSKKSIPKPRLNEIVKHNDDFGLVKIKIYSSTGETIFSTDESEIGYVNKNVFFHEFLAKGKVYTKLVTHDEETSEGKKLAIDVVETYIPLMNDNIFMGAFEIYYDITERVAELSSLASRSCLLLHSFTSLLLIIITLVLIREYRSIEKRRQAEEALRGQLQFSQQLIDTIPNPVFYKDREGRYLGCNSTFETFVGQSRNELIGKTVYDLAPSREWGDIYRESDLSVLNETGIQFYETSIKVADGNMREVMVHKAAFNDITGEVAGLVGVITDISEIKRTEEALRASENKLHVLSSHLLTVQERERKRISLELHDELGQSLTLLKLQMRSVQRKLHEDQKGLRKEAESIIVFIDQVIESARRLSRDLSPAILEDLGLSAALRSMVDEFTARSNIKVSLDLEDVDDLIPAEKQILIYRIIQESLTNIGKHSKSQQVSLAIERGEGEVTLVVEDYGRGFDVKEVSARYSLEKGLGLAAIGERTRMLGGYLEISSSKGKGTKLNVTIPVEVSGGITIEPLSYSTG